MMDCLYAKCTPVISDCVLAELEKLGSKYRIALRIAKDPRFERIQCDHKGDYVDDCIVGRVMAHKCYLVATNDRDLKRRIRKVNMFFFFLFVCVLLKGKGRGFANCYDWENIDTWCSDYDLRKG